MLDICPLCLSPNTTFFKYQKKHERNFFQCGRCDLIFVSRSELISVADEKKRYLMHDNSKRSLGYEKFLMRLLYPVKANLPVSAKGLDFGEGHYPMLREIFAENGFKNMEGFDTYFNKSICSETYDFITASEVIEHIRDVRTDLEFLFKKVVVGGILVISTGIRDDVSNFLDWYYINDVTHINFFSRRTFSWLEKEFSLEILEMDNDLIVFLKK